METVFDYNITYEERMDLGILRKDMYLKLVRRNTANLDLAFMFNRRGDKAKRDEYLNRLPIVLRNNFWRTVQRS